MSRGLLVMFASGDPWKANATLQSGRPAQIADLGQAFHNAGRSTQEADKAFTEARGRVDFWIGDNGQHPITDSAEIQRTATALGLQASQLPKIAVDLENVAAALAQTQGTADGYINALEARLQTLDDWIGQADDMVKQDENLLAQADDDDDICELEDDIDRLEQYINDCEREAVNDTKATLQQLERVRDDYADGLKKAKANLRTDGYDPAAIQALDGEEPKGQAAGDIPPSGFEASELADLRHVTNQAVVDQMAKVRAAQKALDDAAVTAYTKGQGAPEGQAALASLPQLKKNLADALNDLGKLPDYNNVDPAALRASADGHFQFGYTADGQPVQATGQLKNGTGEIFDQGTGTYYTFKDGKLVGMRRPDPGRAEATDEPLLSAVTLAVGAPELKAGGEALAQGFKSLLERRAVGLGADITSENVLPQAVAAAESRAEHAAEQAGHVPTSLPAGAAEHPPGVSATDHLAPATTHMPDEHPSTPGGLLGDHHQSWIDGRLPQVVADPGPEFNLDNPLDNMGQELRALSEQHLTGSHETVLGPYRPPDGGPSYIEVAQQHGASYFDIGNDAWNAATPTERLAANQHVLDIAIENGDTITLSVAARMIAEDSYTAAEIRYLEAHGYQRSGPSTLVPPARGVR
jgi:hypothetical protein